MLVSRERTSEFSILRLGPLLVTDSYHLSCLHLAFRPVADLDLMDWRAKSRSRSRMSMDWRAASRSRSRAPFPSASAYEPAAFTHSEAHSHALLGALDFLNPNQTKNYGTHGTSPGAPQPSTSAGSQSIPIPMNNASFGLSTDHSQNHPHAQSLLDFGFNDARGFSLFDGTGEVAYSEPGHFPSHMPSHSTHDDEQSTSYQHALRTAALFDTLSTDLTAGTGYSQSLPSSASVSDHGGVSRPSLNRGQSEKEIAKVERSESLLVSRRILAFLALECLKV